MRFLIVGLGNIGDKYSGTRHNIGFTILDEVAREFSSDFSVQKLGLISTFTYSSNSVVLLKPSTYMNMSGKSVRYWMGKKKIDLENILIITDDIFLPFGRFRLKTKGSSGGHNGLGSIEEFLNTTEYPRFRFGVGNDFLKGSQIDHVLGKWDLHEIEELKEGVKKSVLAVKSFLKFGLSKTMNDFNKKML
ncbi:aminoacyl-tRNA hydrolase [Ichthyobacterium seriolicida]|uniref:Peptidyl-tRNA hydrolase n=1 Tax=Ichthyobacterium seriolicida TaxID=242600 RepID=A0A1J1E4M8_9FLAO|nr:aminoacyl-tRNA hydrolase [Ichthyobacterium seriolicida]BAV95004.1 peptidyl-tRNA hydrolase [Ichthyobacterium seriolicida]